MSRLLRATVMGRSGPIVRLSIGRKDGAEVGMEFAILSGEPPAPETDADGTGPVRGIVALTDVDDQASKGKVVAAERTYPVKASGVSIGAIVGSMIFPGLGTVLGAVVGAAIPALVGHSKPDEIAVGDLAVQISDRVIG
jgi:hypothetical protein